MSDADQYEAYEQLSSYEYQMRQEYTLVQYANTLSGADVTHDLALLGRMGELKGDYQQICDKMKEQRAKLKADGKTDEEINDIFGTQFSPGGSGTCHFTFEKLNDCFNLFIELL